MKPTHYVVVFISVGFALCIVGIGLIIGGSLSFSRCEEETPKPTNCPSAKENTNPQHQQYVPSEEAIRVHLNDTLGMVVDVFYKLYPNKIYSHPEFVGDDLKRFRPYNCSPYALKERSDIAKRLYKKLVQLKSSVNQTLLQPRELKAVFQLLHYLKTNFGHPYGENYYTGDWMMGPSRFCAEPICRIGVTLQLHFDIHRSWSWRPKSFEDVAYLLQQLRTHQILIGQYISNLKYGIAAGMVRSTEDCEAGYYSFTTKFFNVYRLGSKGILQEYFAKNLLKETFLSKLEDGVGDRWIKINGESIRDSINVTLVEYVGKSLNKLIHFLRDEYRFYCVPSNISSGLATLPLSYVYFNGSRTSNKTTKRLPFGEQLNGKESYKNILYYFTTIEDLTPDKVYKLGQEKLQVLYAEAKKLAENYTEQPANESVLSFKQMLADQSSYFNDAPFPTNESNDVAFTKCSSLADAKLFCPQRYKAFEKWSSFVRDVLSMMDPKTTHMFYFSGKKKTTPGCPLKVVANFNPKTGSQSYVGSGYQCNSPCRYRLPFFMDNYGPIYNAFSVAGHEGRPGHHTQVQGHAENFGDDYWDSITWLENHVYYPSFSEGWALYAENPLLAQNTDIYANNKIQKYGMLKWQIWRALRLIVDTGLHYRGMKRSEALQYHADYAWDTTDKATKDVTRYQSNPGQATSYMIGQLEIWRLRDHTKEKLEAANKEFNEKDFHYQILSQGKCPLEFLKIHIDKYIDCVVRHGTNCNLLATKGESNVDEEEFSRRNHKKMLPIYHTLFHAEHFD